MENYLHGHTGFVLDQLVLKKHPVFGEEFIIDFTEENDFKRNNGVLKSPYTSLLIGPNGTGKSLILKSISDILLDLDSLKFKKKKKHNDNYFNLRYLCGGEEVEITNFDKETNFERKRKKFTYTLFINDEERELNDIPLPSSIIASSLLLTDRFTVYRNAPQFYKYLGVRSLTSPTTARTRNYVKRTVDLVVSSLAEFDTEIKYKIRDVLSFLGFEETFIIQYSPKYRDQFFTGELTTNRFIELFINFSNEQKGFSKRENMSFVPFGVSYFEKNILNNKEGIANDLVEFLNEIVNSGKLVNKEKSKTMIFNYNILNDELSLEKYQLLNHLQALDLISYPTIRLKKTNEEVNLEDTSSGEYHIISNLIGIYASISQNSIVLLDEPEISLHPNWQMKYMTFLKRIFKDYSSCHFVITSHSHFFASDLDGNTSKIIGLKRGDKDVELVNLPKNVDTFGWSAEEVLYKIFNVRSTRNYFFEYDLNKLITLINRNSTDIDEIEQLVHKFSEITLSEEDPLTIILEKAKKYIEQND